MKDNSTPNKSVTTEVTTDNETEVDNVTPPKCFISSIISGGLAFAVYLLFNSIVQTYANKPIAGTSVLVVNITSAVRTLVMGTMALATAVFALVALGLFLLGIQLTFQGMNKESRG